MGEHLGYMVGVIAADASTMAVSGDALSLPQIVGYIVAALVGGGAAWKALPILMARFAVTLAGAKSERDIIARLEAQLAAADKEADDARRWANEAFKERNDILGELGEVKAVVAQLTERTTDQAQTIERQNGLIQQLTEKMQQLQESFNAKAI